MSEFQHVIATKIVEEVQQEVRSCDKNLPYCLRNFICIGNHMDSSGIRK